MADQDLPINQKPTNTTLDDLAVMIKNGFDNTATKKDLAAVEESLSQDIANMSKDIAKMSQDIAKIDERLQLVETKLDRALYTEYVHLETRVKRLEEKVGIKTA